MISLITHTKIKVKLSKALSSDTLKIRRIFRLSWMDKGRTFEDEKGQKGSLNSKLTCQFLAFGVILISNNAVEMSTLNMGTDEMRVK